MSKGTERVKQAKDLLAEGATYSRGCSEFVCKVLGIPWQSANSLMGSSPSQVGANNHYADLSPGDVAGWVNPAGHGHVAIYIGEPGMTFIDVRENGATPRKLTGYGPQPLYKSSR